jgi:hypothetical protein
MKRLASILCTGLLLATATAALAVNPTSNVFEPIDKSPTQVPGGWTDTGGETPATATLIPGFPYTDSDNTCGHSQEVFASCGANSAPDLFYRYVPGSNMNVNVSTCGSTYDTVIYVLENGVEIACNDDSCGLQSELNGVALVAGRTYVFGVSGFSTACGVYTLNITRAVDCVYVCPPGSQLEGEPRCADNYIDNYNGGCNSTPNVFTDLTCNYVCGEMGTFLNAGQQFRDTDWYRLRTGATPCTISYNGMANGYPIARYILGGVCPNVTLLAGPGVNCGVLSYALQANTTYYFFAGTTGFTGVPCGTPYWLTFDGCGLPTCGATAVEPTTWGNIKNVYR